MEDGAQENKEPIRDEIDAQVNVKILTFSVMTKKSVQSVMNERVLLSQFTSPFVVNMHFAFQDRDTLYLVLDLMEGGDLRYHIGSRVFS
jgi:serine/threonine protein kinase